MPVTVENRWAAKTKKIMSNRNCNKGADTRGTVPSSRLFSRQPMKNQSKMQTAKPINVCKADIIGRLCPLGCFWAKFGAAEMIPLCKVYA